ncbi:hypothetical protein J437_LFUL009945 [Ladona fulva]|uniref:Partial AB-hydrolase lipase domain-containing protein n=1 Tax=Ladona fulva TaxID=123851 RepID=A0A8K0KA62_LADFU|nr:hypothetical protein J437_LFUL009945 [Ladona fulva]
MKLLLIFACVAFASARPQIGQHPSRYLEDEARDDLPDVYMDTPELIKYYGYPVEEHQVKTEDGYLLTMHRIPHGIGEEPRTGRPVVFLQHGLFCSSSDWVIMGPGKGFGNHSQSFLQALIMNIIFQLLYFQEFVK